MPNPSDILFEEHAFMIPLLSLEWVDWIVIALSLCAVTAAGIYGSRGGGDFILAGRSLTLPFFVASLVATWYGAVLGSTEFIVRHGVVFILCFGVPYYIVAVIYAYWLSHRIRDSKAVSIPDQLGMVHGPRARTLSAVIMLVITIPAAYQLMLGVVIHAITGVSLGYCIVIGTVIALAYVVKGGLRSDVYANAVQVVLMFAGFTALAVGCWFTIGPIGDVISSLPAESATLPGSIGWMGIVVWWIVALQSFIDPNFHVRVAAANTASTARRGILISVALWMVFDVLQLGVGLYVINVGWNGAQTDSLLALANIALPPLWKGLFVSGIIAAVMSTLDGYALVSATTVGHDMIDALSNRKSGKSSLRIGIVVVGLVGALAAFLLPSVVDIIYNAASVAVPALLLPLILSFTALANRFTHAILPIIVIPALASLASFITDTGEPMLIGLACSVLLHLTLPTLRGKRA